MVEEEINKKDEKEEQKGIIGGMQHMGEGVGDAFIEIGKLVGIANKEEQNSKKDKKEVQVTLKGSGNIDTKVSKEELFSILKLIAPGTNFRTSLDTIVKIGKGALIVVENENLAPCIDGGFKVNCRFTPQRMSELSKMDGAIILGNDMKKINYANVLLTPDSSIKTNETGTRHKAAERTAKQTGCIVIAVSERRHEIVLFYRNARHVVKETGEILRTANEQIQLLEKHRELFDLNLEKLNRSELRNYTNLNHAINVIKKGRIIQKISEGLKKYLVELGSEGILLKTRLKEISHNVEKEMDLVIKDYTKIGLKKSKLLLETLSYEELIDTEHIKKVLAYENAEGESIKGWRILSKTSLMEPDIALLIKESGNLGKAIHAEIDFYKTLFGEEKALQFKDEIERIKLSY